MFVPQLAKNSQSSPEEWNHYYRDRVYGDEEMKKCAQETYGWWKSEQHRNSVLKGTRTNTVLLTFVCSANW